jgi:nucleotide-binding universal stress UspA family protein
MSEYGSPIVVGYIFTPEGDAALERAVAEARQRDALLVVVHSERSRAEVEVVDGVEVDETMDPVSSLLAHRDVRFQVRHVGEGADAADDIVAIAEEVDADFIVIGLRRRTPVGKLVMGSHAQRVLLHAGCPVLAVKTA